MGGLPILDVNSLWIGDVLMHVPSGKRGSFVGVVEGLLQMKCEKETIADPATQFLLVEDQESILQDIVEDSPRSDLLHEGQELDLHIERLDPSRRHDDAILIRNFQLRRCREFLEQAIEQGLSTLTIIHGRGEGVLESDVLTLLNAYDEVVDTQAIHNGGAQKVTLRRIKG